MASPVNGSRSQTSAYQAASQPLLSDRVVLAIEITKSQEAPAVLRPVERALEGVFDQRRHVPDGLELRSDHGPQYTGNAIAERVIQTLKVVRSTWGSRSSARRDTTSEGFSHE